VQQSKHHFLSCKKIDPIFLIKCVGYQVAATLSYNSSAEQKPPFKILHAPLDIAYTSAILADKPFPEKFQGR